MANAEKLRKLVSVIRAADERGEWNQETWACQTPCGTTYCAAGWQAVIDGHTIVFDELYGSGCKWNWRSLGSRLADGGEYWHVVVYATAALELTANEASHLFHWPGDNVDEFAERVEEVIRGKWRGPRLL